MARFPLFVDLTDQKVLVIGGGRTALRKINTLLQFDAQIYTVCASSCNEVKEMADRGLINLFDMDFSVEIISGTENLFMVICASDDHELNRETALYCRAHHIWVDCVDSARLSTFVFPSIVRRENVVVGISTSGSAPVLAKHLRGKIEDAVPDWYGDLAKELSEKREILKNAGLSEAEKRSELMKMIKKREEMQINDCRNQKEQAGCHPDTDGA